MPRKMPPTVYRLALAVLAAATLAGCKTIREDWASVPERHEPRVELVQVQHSVHFEASSARLSGEEREKLSGFLARNAVAPGDALYVIAGPALGSVAERRRQTVAAYLTHLALPPRNINGDFGLEPVGVGSVAVVVRRHLVTLPSCPDWSDEPSRNWNNTVSANWGCATAVNFGLMVADPGDLVRGRGDSLLDGEFAVLAIQRYRAGETKKLDPEDVKKIQEQQKTGDGDGGSEGD